MESFNSNDNSKTKKSSAEEKSSSSESRQYSTIDGMPLAEKDIELIFQESSQILISYRENLKALNESDEEKATKTQNEMQEKSNKKFVRDYKALDAITGSGIAELWNQKFRLAQKDAFITELIKNFNELPTSLKVIAIKNTFEMLEKCIEAHRMGLDEGSTALAVIATQKKLLVSNLGDSTALVIHLDKNGNLKNKPIHLNEYLHSPDNPEELKRFKKDNIRQKKNAPTKIYFDEKNASFSASVTGALGDQALARIGLTHNPMISEFDFNSLPHYEEGDQIILLTACDGLTENHCLSFDEIGKLISEGIRDGLSLTDVAARLVTTAQEKGSEDNITAVLTKIDIDSPTSKLIALFDGHGGMNISQLAAKLYAPYFRLQIQLQYINSMDKALGSELQKIMTEKIIKITDPVVLKMIEENLSKITNKLSEGTYSDKEREPIIKALNEFIFVSETKQDFNKIKMKISKYEQLMEPEAFKETMASIDREYQTNLLKAQTLLEKNDDIGLVQLRRSINDRNTYLQELFKIVDIILAIPLHEKNVHPNHVQTIITLHETVLSHLQNGTLVNSNNGISKLIEYLTNALDKAKKENNPFETFLDMKLLENTVFKKGVSYSAVSLLNNALQKATEIQRSYNDLMAKAVKARQSKP